MPANPPENTPRITPYLLYEDAESAIQFLTRAFGFTERMRMPGPDGKVAHAELELGDGLLMLGHPGPDYRSPKSVGHTTQNLYVYVDDVDKHFQSAKEQGATPMNRPISSTVTGATAAWIQRATNGSSRSTSVTSHPRT